MAILNRGTLVLAGCAIAFGGAVLLIENRPDNVADSDSLNDESALVNSPAETGELMFPFAEADIESFTLSRPGETLAFSKDENGFWQMSAPQVAEAEGGAIAFLLNQLTNVTARSLSIAPDTLEKFDLIEPDVSIDLIAEGKPYQLLLGGADFTGDQRYVRAVNPDEETTDTPETINIHLVSGGITSAVDRPTEEWLVEPEANSEPAKTDGDTETAAPSTEKEPEPSDN